MKLSLQVSSVAPADGVHASRAAGRGAGHLARHFPVPSTHFIPLFLPIPFSILLLIRTASKGNTTMSEAMVSIDLARR